MLVSKINWIWSIQLIQSEWFNPKENSVWTIKISLFFLKTGS